jgi:phage terminase large subunit GpA-like protein
MSDPALISLGRSLLAPSDSGDVVEWCEDNVVAIPDSPLPGPFRSERTPWIAEGLRICADPEVRLVTVLASIQSGKTLLARLLSCHIAARAPGPTLILQDNDQNARDFNLTALRPLWDNCPPVKARLVPEMDRSSTIQFETMTAWVLGAHNDKNLQRRAIRWLIGDECWLWPKGHIGEASARVTAFGWLGKRLFMSQGSTAGDDFDVLWQSTDQRDWNFRCPSCDHLQPWLWEQVRFPDEARTADGWDKTKVAQGTTYECLKCRERLPDKAGTRHACNAKGTFVATSPGTGSGKVGLHWNSLASMSWGELAVLSIEAQESFDTYGDESPRRIFKQKRLAMPWADEGGAMVSDVKAADYKIADAWPEEAWLSVNNGKVTLLASKPDKAGLTDLPLRTMGIDVQRGHFWAVVRSWSSKGESRLRWFGKVESWAGLEAIAKEQDVNHALVGVDSGDQTQMVYAECGKRGWKATKGSGQSDFAVGQNRRRFYSDPLAVSVPGLRGRVRLYTYSNLALKDILHAQRIRRLHTYPIDTSSEYVDQMDAEVRVKDRKSGKPMWILPQGKKDNHAHDCECIALLMAVRCGVVGREQASAVEEEM